LLAMNDDAVQLIHRVVSIASNRASTSCSYRFDVVVENRGISHTCIALETR